jgi:hypothetical protein
MMAATEGNFVFRSFLSCWGRQMSTLQERLAAITDTTANLKAQFRELDRLREHVRKAELRIAAQRATQSCD